MPYHFCHKCGGVNEYLSPSRAATAAGVGRSTLYRWIERKLLHTVVRPSGRILVCKASLLGHPLTTAEKLRRPKALRASD